MYLEQILLLLRPVLQLCRHEELASLVFGMDHSLDLHQDCEIYDLFGE
jgi:hypothetical protein